MTSKTSSLSEILEKVNNSLFLKIKSKSLSYKKHEDLNSLQSFINNKNVLIIGAGGIGCELLKCLVMSSFKNISIVDMDMIEKTNLNRQFLFNKQSVGKYKSVQAIERVMEIRNTNDTSQTYNLNSFIGNIMDKTKFPLSFFKKFEVILNALDNIEARSYINNLCYMLNIPLINGGTEGLKGFVGVYPMIDHDNDIYPCYDCSEKVKKVTIPICSIKQSPYKLEHCIAWAMNIFEMFFCGDVGNGIFDISEIRVYRKMDFIEIIHRLFYEDLVIVSDDSVERNGEHIKKIDIKSIYNRLYDCQSGVINQFPDDNSCRIDDNEQFDYKSTYEIEDLLRVLIRSYKKIEEERNIEKSSTLSYEKDSSLHNDFLFSLTNLRAFNFNINMDSKFKIQQLAGNIVPAVVGTNAIISGMEVIEAIKSIKNIYEKYILNKSSSEIINNNRSISLSSYRKVSSIPIINDNINKTCTVCHSKRVDILLFFLNSVSSLTDFKAFIVNELNLNEEFDFFVGKSLIILDEEDEDFNEDVLKRSIYDIYMSNEIICIITNNGFRYSIYIEPMTNLGMWVDVVDEDELERSLFKMKYLVDRRKNYSHQELYEEVINSEKEKENEKEEINDDECCVIEEVKFLSHKRKLS